MCNLLMFDVFFNVVACRTREESYKNYFQFCELGIVGDITMNMEQSILSAKKEVKNLFFVYYLCYIGFSVLLKGRPKT